MNKNMDAWPAGYGRRILAEVDSTLTEAARIAPELPGPEWILALRQTAGRGRRGRVWTDPAGNFAATLVLRPAEPPDRAALRSFVAALAVFDAVVAVTGRTEGLALKWPNDVLLNGGKLAGILLESSGYGRVLGYLAIGVGVNLRTAPPVDDAAALRPVALLQETGADVGPEAFLEHLAAAYARHEARFQADGFAPIRADWLDRAARIGTEITARTMTETLTGRFDTVDAAGNLVLWTGGTSRHVPAADVFF